uniref:HlyC/CorC family transporter n=1 Tax=Eiseniibacteriota bacterium TaxID=2212470 RepID=A0A832MJZ5_UNCEI
MLSVLLEALGLLAIPLLVALNGFFVAAEFALVKMRRTRAEELVAQGRFGAGSVRQAVLHLDDAIAATQLGITFASLALGWVGEPALAHLFDPLFRFLPGDWSAAAKHAVSVAVAFMLITYMHVVLGELAPKALALQRTEDVALVVSGPLLAFGRVFRPFIHFMNRSGNWVVRKLNLPPLAPGRLAHSVEELRMLVEETEQAGVMPTEEASYAKNVLRLTDKRVRDVMVPREKVVTIALNASEEQVLETARETAHTRMPVWEGDPENIVGIVNTKDLFHLFSLKGLVILADAMYPPLFVHPEQRVAWLLQLFRREKRPMAVVRDAAGRFLGIVTLEDILEEIVGEIEDEHDDPRWLEEDTGAPSA